MLKRNLCGIALDQPDGPLAGLQVPKALRTPLDSMIEVLREGLAELERRPEKPSMTNAREQWNLANERLRDAEQEVTPDATPENVAQLAQEKKEHIKKQLDGLARNLRQIETHLSDCRKKESAARTRRDKVRDQQTSLKEAIAALDEEAASWRIRAEDTVLSHTRIEATRNALKQIPADIETSKTKQDAAQKSIRGSL